MDGSVGVPFSPIYNNQKCRLNLIKLLSKKSEMFEMSRFINGKSNIHLICMPAAGSKKFLKIKFKPSGVLKKGSNREGIGGHDPEHVDDLRTIFSRFDGPERAKRLLDLPRNLSSSGSQKARVVGGVHVKGNFKHLSEETSKRQFSVDRFSNSDSSLLERKVRDPKLLTADLVRRENTSARFLSVMTYTGRIVGNKRDNRLLRTKSPDDGNHGERLSESRKLQLFRTLLKKPLPTLELRTCFGVSKQALKGLCKRGLLAEVWGPGTVGLRFGLTRKGKAYLDELKAAAKYDSRISKRGTIRLKNRF